MAQFDATWAALQSAEARANSRFPEKTGAHYPVACAAFGAAQRLSAVSLISVSTTACNAFSWVLPAARASSCAFSCR